MSENPKLWGGRFEGGISRAVWDFCKGISSDVLLLPFEIEVNKAQAKALYSAQIINKAQFDKISKALVELEEELGKEHSIGFEEEDIHSFVLNKLAEKIGEDAKFLHSGRSRNDLVATDNILLVIDACRMMSGKLEMVQKALLGFADRHYDAFIPFYTHLQQAQVVRFPHYIYSYISALERQKGLLSYIIDSQMSPLGSAAGSGSSLPIDVNAIAQDIGFESPCVNSIDAVANRDYFLFALFAFSNIALTLSRMAEDWIIYLSTEYGYMAMDDSVATGSSIMPHKKNPDVLELVRGKTGAIIGALFSLFTLMKGLPSAYNRDMQEDKEIFSLALYKLTDVLTVMPHFIEHVSLNEARIAQVLNENDYLYATDVMEELIIRGMDSRMAHSLVGRLVAYCEKNGVRLKELTQKTRLEFGIDIDDNTWLAFFSPENSTDRKKTYAGTSKESVDRQRAFWKERLASQG